MRSLKVAAIQLQSGPDPRVSVDAALALTKTAIATGADLVVLPENYAGIAPSGTRGSWGFEAADPCASEIVRPFVELSQVSPALIVLGGAPEHPEAPGASPGADRAFNTSLVLRHGELLARYRKIHLFDATLSDGRALTESAHTRPGSRPVLLHTPLARIGLSICYDLRFPEHYRALSKAGAEVILVPSAFTRETGEAHWEILLKARAIENQCWVIAPAQDGFHAPGRNSYGNTMIIDPWGRTVSSRRDGPGVVFADIGPVPLATARSALPALQHRVLASETSVEAVSLDGSDWSA